MIDLAVIGVDASIGWIDAEDWAFVWEHRQYLFEGTLLTVALTVVSVALGFVAGFPSAAIEVYGGPLSSGVVRTVGVVLRGTPILVILMFAFFVFPEPSNLLAESVPHVSEAFAAAVIGLGLRSAAYQSQLFRGSIQSVSEAQLEAARSIGLSTVQSIRHVVVPQALRRSVPGFQNEFTIVLKDTSIAFAIGLAELLTHTYDLFVQQTTAVLELVLFASAIYFVLTFATNRALDHLEATFAIPTGETT